MEDCRAGEAVGECYLLLSSCLNLLLKDIATITQVRSVMDKMEHILHRFWGRTRMPRTKLLERTTANHGKKLGLCRAKVTRFAGKVRAHMLITYNAHP